MLVCMTGGQLTSSKLANRSLSVAAFLNKLKQRFTSSGTEVEAFSDITMRGPEYTGYTWVGVA